VGIGSKYKYSNIAYLWLQVAFYTVTITAVFAKLTSEVTKADILSAFFPVTNNHYWYFTAYFAVFLLIPIFNGAISSMTKKQLIATAVSIILLFSLIPMFTKKDIFFENAGYSALWLSLLYILGGIIKKCDIMEKVKGFVAVLMYFVMVILTFIQKYFIDRHNLNVAGGEKMTATLVSYISPTILFAGIFLLIAFAKLKTGKVSQKLIAFFAPVSFGVYLIHVQKYVWVYFMKDRFVDFAGYGVIGLVLAVIGSAIAIYVICSLIDFVRDRLFKLLHIKELLIKLEGKLFKDTWQKQEISQ
jgi:surface polysaccharide O-acyltransferase-like enzyme